VLGSHSREPDYPVPRGERTFRAFVWAIRTRPGFQFKVLATAAFGLGVVLKSGVLVMLAWGGGGVALGVAIGYPLFRRSGRVPG
jgi:hypothetical protein